MAGTTWRKASKSFQRVLFDASKKVSDTAIVVMAQTSADFIDEVGSMMGNRGAVPYYTGNLLDSIGARILEGNRLLHYRTMSDVVGKHATKPQHMASRKNIWGDVELMQRIMRPSTRTGKSIVAQLMIGVPYAQEVDNKENYSEDLTNRFYDKIDRSLQRISKYNYLVE